MNDLSLHRGEMLGVPDHPVIESGTHRQQHIAVLHGHIGLISAVHAQHAQELRVGRGDGA